jgi:hypothetical protein
LLEFDKDNRLIHHESADDPYVIDPMFIGDDSYFKQINCLSIVKYKLVTDIRPGRIIEKAELSSKEEMGSPIHI